MTTERRKLPRVNLRLPILVVRPGVQEPLRSETTDISNGGFYFTTQIPLSPGEKVKCVITLPGHGTAKAGLLLSCDAEVVRVVARAEIPGFGIGCRIGQYQIVTAPTIEASVLN